MTRRQAKIEKLRAKLAELLARSGAAKSVKARDTLIARAERTREELIESLREEHRFGPLDVGGDRPPWYVPPIVVVAPPRVHIPAAEAPERLGAHRMAREIPSSFHGMSLPERAAYARRVDEAAEGPIPGRGQGSDEHLDDANRAIRTGRFWDAIDHLRAAVKNLRSEREADERDRCKP
jgi:hypothetical protein